VYCTTAIGGVNPIAVKKIKTLITLSLPPPPRGQEPIEGQGLLITKERRLRVFENRVLSIIFGPKIDEEIRKRKNTRSVV
jgi:hypothetical protein